MMFNLKSAFNNNSIFDLQRTITFNCLHQLMNVYSCSIFSCLVICHFVQITFQTQAVAAAAVRHLNVNAVVKNYKNPTKKDVNGVACLSNDSTCYTVIKLSIMKLEQISTTFFQRADIPGIIFTTNFEINNTSSKLQVNVRVEDKPKQGEATKILAEETYTLEARKTDKLFTQVYNKPYSSFEVNFNIKCAKYYYGEICSTYCKEKSQGSYICNRITGLKNCTTGWSGEDCEFQKQSCQPNPCPVDKTCLIISNALSYTCVTRLSEGGNQSEETTNQNLLKVSGFTYFSQKQMTAVLSVAGFVLLFICLLLGVVVSKRKQTEVGQVKSQNLRTAATFSSSNRLNSNAFDNIYYSNDVQSDIVTVRPLMRTFSNQLSRGSDVSIWKNNRGAQSNPNISSLSCNKIEDIFRYNFDENVD